MNGLLRVFGLALCAVVTVCAPLPAGQGRSDRESRWVREDEWVHCSRVLSASDYEAATKMLSKSLIGDLGNGGIDQFSNEIETICGEITYVDEFRARSLDAVGHYAADVDWEITGEMTLRLSFDGAGRIDGVGVKPQQSGE